MRRLQNNTKNKGHRQDTNVKQLYKSCRRSKLLNQKLLSKISLKFSFDTLWFLVRLNFVAPQQLRVGHYL